MSTTPSPDDSAEKEVRENESPSDPVQGSAQQPLQNGTAQPADAPAEPDANKGNPAASDTKNANRGAILLDIFLIVLLLSILGGGSYYLKKELDHYRVPTEMEIAMEEFQQLAEKRDSLQATYYHADEQIHMRKRLARLDSQLKDIQKDTAALQSAIEEQKNIILARQHEIRQADADARIVARSLLPGMPIGTASTTKGKVVRNATIYKLERKLITLRSPEGQMRFPLKELITDNLPPLARYAFGVDNIVDMSDFDSSPTANPPKNTSNQPSGAGQSAPKKVPIPTTGNAAAKKTTFIANHSYDFSAGNPIVDTETNGAEEHPLPSPIQRVTETWQPPTEALPL